MKRVLFVGLLCSLLAVPLHAADIYWDQNPPDDPTISKQDFKHKYGSFKPAKSLEQMDIYDSGERLKLDYEVQEEIEEAMRRANLTRDEVIDLPQSAPPAITRPEPTKRTRSTIQPAPRDLTPARVEPAVEPEAVTRPEIRDEPRRPLPVPAIADEPAKTEPKKLQWGQSQEPTPTSEPPTKFKWGEGPK